MHVARDVLAAYHEPQRLARIESHARGSQRHLYFHDLTLLQFLLAVEAQHGDDVGALLFVQVSAADAQSSVCTAVFCHASVVLEHIVSLGRCAWYGELSQHVVVSVELLHYEEQVHVVASVGLDEEVCLWIADEIGAFVDRQVERGFRRSTLAEIERGNVSVLRSLAHLAGLSVQKQFLVFGAYGWELRSRLVDEVAALHVVQAVAHGGCVFPSVVLSLHIVVEEAQPFLHVLRLVVVLPFQVVVYAQPLLLASELPPCAEGAVGVEHVGVRSHDEYGHIDVADAGNLVLPERMVGIGILSALFCHVLAQAEALVVVLYSLGEHIVGHTSHEAHIAIAVGECLRHLRAYQMLRAFGSDEPLREREVGSAAHGHLAVAPGLSGHPFHEVGTVLSLLSAEHGAVALAASDAARVGIDDGIAVGTPEIGVGTLELLQSAHALLVESQESEQVLEAFGIARVLAVWTPCDDGRQRLVGVGRQINVCQYLHPVGQGHLLVLHEADVVVERMENLVDDSAFLQQVLA